MITDIRDKTIATDADPSATSITWHTHPQNAVLDHLSVTVKDGLAPQEAATRLAQYGPNELTESQTTSVWAILWAQLTEPLVLLLIFAAVVSAGLGKADSVIAISAIVVLNALLGVTQEYRAEKAMAALRQLSAPLVRVRRGGAVLDVPSAEIVPGDLILLEAGNIIAADARLVEAVNLQIGEASLTGESLPVDKTVEVLDQADAPLGDRRNMVYMGTAVSYGRGAAVVVATGMQTELGKIATLLQSVENIQTPLQRRMNELGKVMFAAAIVIMLVSFLIGIVQGSTIADEALTAVAIAVAVVPEGLPAVVTISLALGTQRMLRRHALIRKLPAVETLGSVTVICSDKTGTLTENKMKVVALDTADLHRKDMTGGDETHQTLLMAGAMCNDAILRDDGSVVGDPTEGALLVAARDGGLNHQHLLQGLPRVAEVPFSSERKRMTTVHQAFYDRLNGSGGWLHGFGVSEGHYIAFSKGAVDRLLDKCVGVWAHDHIEPLTVQWVKRIEAATDQMASDGLRVLGFAYRVMTEIPADNTIEQDLIFVGMMGMIDPPRPEVKRAIEVAKGAGIRPVMITGDHPKTAHAIAVDLRLTAINDPVVTGPEVTAMTDTELAETVERVSVFARVSPEDKLRIVRAFQHNGHIAAMTGDGVNDAAALKQANIGVAMGITGTDVSKEAADMVITDDNFATIVHAAEEGRTIYDNIRRFVKYLLASNTGELSVLLITQLIAGMTLPLTTLQILWMNLITDGIPALALGTEKAESNAMQRPPYAPNESLFGRGLGRHILIVGFTLGLTAISIGYWAWDNNIEAANGALAWNTMVFMVLTMAQMGHALALRSHSQSIFTMNPFGNRFLIGAVLMTLGLQLLAIYTPFFNDLFNTNPLTLGQLALIMLVSTTVFWAVELEKLLIRRGVFKG